MNKKIMNLIYADLALIDRLTKNEEIEEITSNISNLLDQLIFENCDCLTEGKK